MNAGRAKRKGEIRWPLLNELARIKPGEYCIRPTPPQPLKPSRPRMTSRPVDVNATSLYTPTVPGPRRLAAPLQRQTVASMTVEALRERILRGDYPEGEPLRQDALADELGVSRIPVREALRQLEAEGLVTFSPHRGAVVSTLSLEEIEELFELRADIEADLLRRAMPHVATEDVTRAKEILDAYETALRDGDIASWG